MIEILENYSKLKRIVRERAKEKCNHIKQGERRKNPDYPQQFTLTNGTNLWLFFIRRKETTITPIIITNH